MKRIFVFAFLFLMLGSAQMFRAQSVMFWYETFGLGCNQGQQAQGATPTGTNGSWSVVNIAAAPGNGAQSNEWFISATDAGRPPGACADGCLNNAGLTNRSLHISSNLAPPQLDPGAVYLQSATSNTNKRAQSPIINCTGRNTISLSFNYFIVGNAPNDNCEVLYFDGAVWSVLAASLTPNNMPCAPFAQWSNTTIPLPASANGNANVRIGFRWQNAGAVGAGNISVAIDELQLTCPVVTFTMPSQACANFATTWTSMITPTAGVTDYSWTSAPTMGTFAPATASNPAMTFSATGIHTITAYAMNNGVITCSSTATVNIVNQLTFTATASPATVCPGDIITLSAWGATAYAWSPGNLVGSPVLASPTVPTVYTVTGNDPGGCPGTGTVLVTMGAYPLISVVASASAVCNGFTSTLTASGAGSYTWTGTGLPVPVNVPTIAVGPGSYTVCGSTAGLPCAQCSVVTVNTASPLVINVSTNPQTATTCISANFPPQSKGVNLCASGAGVYNWAPASSLNYSIGPCVIAKPIVSTCYTVTGVTSVCSGSTIVCVTVVPQYSMDVIPKQPILCVGDSIQLKIANIGTTSVGPYNYNWMEPANAPPPSIDQPLAGTVIISPTNMAQPVTYSAEVIDSRGCASIPRLVTTTVLPLPVTSIAIPTINAVPINSVCYVGGGSGSNPEAIITLTANNNNFLPPGVVPTYTWYPPYAPPYGTMAIVTPANEATVILAAPMRTPDVVTYTIQSGYNGIPGCRRIDTVSLRVIDCRPLTPTSTQFTTALPNDTICSRTCITFVNMTDTAAGGPQTYTWTFPGGAPATSTLANPTICYNLPGKYNVILKAFSPYNKPTGSTDIEARQNYIKVVDVPNPKILPKISAGGKDTTIRYGQSITLTATNAVSYIWYPNYNVSATTGSVITATPRKDVSYIVEGFNSAGCFSRDTITVKVIDDCGQMFIPNAFSPNNDGANDQLFVRGVCLESMTFMVFNKWGEKVFETTDQEIGWDGTFKGELLNTDVFVYRLEGKTHTGEKFNMKGNVTLIR